jgi:predicted RNA-binding Zn ribbon-like protein
MNIDDVLWSEYPWLDLLNSDWHDHLHAGHDEDRLEIKEWLEYFLARWKFDVRGIPRQQVIQSLRELRSIIFRIAERYAHGQKTTPQEWHRLNKYLKNAPYIRQLLISRQKPFMEVIPVGSKLEIVLGEIAGSFAGTVVSGDPFRTKMCQNKNCRWVFYDTSKNRTRRWCDQTCRNLMKVRQFRLRSKE